MAEVNTGTTEEKFVFGQNMEDRAIKPATDAKEDHAKSENGAESEKRSVQSPLRPSAFRPGGGILAPSRLGANPFTHRPAANNSIPDVSLKSNPFAAKGNPTSSVSCAESDAGSGRMILKPSALARQTANFGRTASPGSGTSSNYKTTFKLEPAKLTNPFDQPKAADHKENVNKDESTVQCSEVGNSEQGTSSVGPSTTVCTSPASKGAEGDTNDACYVPAKSKSFIFGENMEKRVKDGDALCSQSTLVGGPVSSPPSFLFGERVSDRISDATSPPLDNDKDKNTTVDADSSAQTLVESAAAHQAKQTRPELIEVDTKTGEENESNVFQINAKLFAFESATQSYLERGRGLLRLNDMSATNKQAFQSRLVMRTQGSLRVILNTKVWSGMLVERASQKSVRVTACEGENDVKVFLIMANPKDADQILSAIDWRVQQQQKLEKVASEASAMPDRSEAQKTMPAPEVHPEKRPSDHDTSQVVAKKPKLESNQRREMPTEESNDSSTLDTETEVSNESFTTTKSSSSE